MTPRVNKLYLMALLLALPIAGRAAPPKSTNAVPQYKAESTFLIPRNPAEGRDPFFPGCTSLYQTATPAKAAPVSDIGQLKLTGLSGTSFAQINNMTLEVGETEEVKTATGIVSVHLLEIRAADESVVIIANGQRKVLSSK